MGGGQGTGNRFRPNHLSWGQGTAELNEMVQYNNQSNYEVWCKFRIAAKVQDALHRKFQEVNLGQHFGACSQEDLEAQCKHLILSFN